MQSNPAALRQLREARGHTRSSLSRETGVAQSRISQYELRPTAMYATTAKKLADYFDVPITVIARSDEPEPAEVAS